MQITLAAARVNAGLSQEKVAKHMKKSKATIVAWEKGKIRIDKANFDSLCSLYEINGGYIFLPTRYTKSEQL